MRRVRINMVVEGQTEEAFVKQVLAAYLRRKAIFPEARRGMTSRDRRVWGGMSTYYRARKDIENWLEQDRAGYCTTMFDLYALPKDFPGYDHALTMPDPYDRVRHLERSMEDDIGNDRFIANLLLHEFEALLYSDPRKLDHIAGLMQTPSQVKQLEQVLAACGGPELVNDHPDTAPSKRLLRLYRGYNKVLFGVLVARQIGIDDIRAACPHFDSWLARLESLPPLLVA